VSKGKLVIFLEGYFLDFSEDRSFH